MQNEPGKTRLSQPDMAGGEVTPLANGGSIWRALVTRGGITVRSWDQRLSELLVEALGVSDDVPGAFDSVSSSEFVRAFFSVAEPFVQMWSDLLRTLELAGVRTIGNELRIEYRFEDDDPKVSFSLAHFRQAQEIWARRPRRFDLRDVDAGELYGDYLSQGAQIDYESQTDLGRFAQRFWVERDEEPWPRPVPPLPAVDDIELQPLAEEIHELAALVLDELYSVSESRRHLLDMGPDTATGPAGTPGTTLFAFGDDMWVGIALQIVDALTTASATDIDIATLRRNLVRLRSDDRDLVDTRALEEFLALPLWRYRHELFSTWVNTVVIAALDDQDPEIHSQDGALTFGFTATHLATFRRTSPPLQLVTELRTPLESPVGKSRSAAIQPDISLVHDYADEADQGPITIECKQYLRPANRSFGEALTDYARGRPESAVLLVDHGRLNEASVLQYVAADVRGRCAAIGLLSPTNQEAMDRLVDLIRQGAGCAPTMVVVADLSASCFDQTVATITQLHADELIGFGDSAAYLSGDVDWVTVGPGSRSRIELVAPLLQRVLDSRRGPTEVHIVSDFMLDESALATILDLAETAGATVVRHPV